MKRLLLLISMCGLFSIVCNAQANESLDSVVAVVNTSVITQSELAEAIEKTKKQMTASNITVPNNENLQKTVLDQLINRKLQLDIAHQAGLKVTPAEVEKTIRSIANNNHLSLEQLYSVVEKQGLTKEAYRKEIQEEFLIHKVQRQSIGRKAMVSPQEVDEFMNSSAWMALNNKEYHIEDILITLPEAPSTQQMLAAKKQAENLVIKLHQGADFKETAVTASGDNKALQGGDLGWRKLPEIPSAFSDLLVQMKLNDIYGPIQTPNGFHIIHLAGIRNASESHGNAEQERKKIQELLYDRKYEEALQGWLTQLRGESFINTHLEG